MTQQRVALVTGASSGIGLATAGLLEQSGFRVFGTSRKPAASPEPTGNVEMVRLDVRDDASVRSCVEAVLRQAGRLDALINNAGYALIGSAEETSLQEARDLFETNFFGVVRMTQAVLPIMREQRSGRIAIIGSAVGFLPAPYQAIYSATKHALEGYAESLDHEVRQFGIRVSVIEPGFIRTNIAENSQLVRQPLEVYSGPRNRVVDAIRDNVAKGEEAAGVASVVYNAVTSRSPRVRYAAGRQAKFLGRVRKFAPSRLFERGLRKQFRLDAA